MRPTNTDSAGQGSGGNLAAGGSDLAGGEVGAPKPASPSLAALRELRAWIQVWMGDRDCNLAPTWHSLATALAIATAAIAQEEVRA
jgi:hypothetical protein